MNNTVRRTILLWISYVQYKKEEPHIKTLTGCN